MNKDKNIKDRERVLRELILYFKDKKVSYTEFSSYLEDAYKIEKSKKARRIIKTPGELAIPVSVFNNNYLSSLETIVKYLRENKNLTLSGIARLLNRDPRAIGVTYRFARKKLGEKLEAPASKQLLPVKLLADKKMSVLENIVYYLKMKYSLSYHDIAVMLRRDDRTIWTVYQRALKKIEKT